MKSLQGCSFIPETRNEINSDAFEAHLEEVPLGNEPSGSKMVVGSEVTTKWRLPRKPLRRGPADAQQLLSGSLTGGRQFIISPAADSGSAAGEERGGGGGGRGRTAGWFKAKGRRENGCRREGVCAPLTWK